MSARAAKCPDCGRFTQTLCLVCSSPLCEDHAEFPVCADCSAEEHRQALIDEIDRARVRAEAEEGRWRSTLD